MQTTVLKNVNLLDGTSPAVPNSTVVVSGERISEVRAGQSGFDSFKDARVVDLAGRSLLPGLATTHFHSTYSNLGSIVAPFGLDRPMAYQTLLAARNLAFALDWGYTSVVSAAAAHDIDASLAQAIKDGVIEGPRLIPGSRELSSTGHANDASMNPWWWGISAQGAARIVDGPDQVLHAVRDEIKRGARIIKLYITGGHGVASPRDQLEMSREEVAVAVEAAHARGVPVRAHVANKPAILMAVELGIDVIDHADGMDEECFAAFVENGTFVVPSIRFPEVMLSMYLAKDPNSSKRFRADLDTHYEAVARANEAGVCLTLGDDYGALGLPHGSYSEEFRSYTKNVGVSSLDVIKWATVNGAAMMKRSTDLGTIEEGKIADLIVVDGDPSADVSVLADAIPACVMKGGEIVRGELAG